MSRPARTLKTASELLEAGLIDTERLGEVEAVARRFAVAITPAMMELIEGTPQTDPIAAQFVPTDAELAQDAAELHDPIGDKAFSPVPGIVHRYPDRVLLKAAHACPVYCRFCFRREMIGSAGEPLSARQLNAALDYIAAHEGIWEVILTGGDPLALSPRRIGAIVKRLDAMAHVRVLRVHTRVPVVTPERISEDLLQALQCGKATYIVLHANHVRELTAACRRACGRIIDAGMPMLSQTVLLRGVNDDAASLSELFRTLVEIRVKPYYLHHGDLARGTRHFRKRIADGQAIMRELRGTLSGLAQPAYVLDIPGGHGKVPVGPCYLHEVAAGEYEVTDPKGGRHRYVESVPEQDEGASSRRGPAGKSLAQRDPLTCRRER